ncbi:MAG TPA: cardiolipin synthase [Gemmataceae bacterium]|nr:cardiolipin synthase [Gemmataceae bacterium]
MTIVAALDWPSITGSLALVNFALAALTVFWVLTVKREPTSALAWCLLVVLVPLLGSFLFVVFGYQIIHVPLRRKRRHAAEFRARPPVPEGPDADGGYEGLAALARRLGAAPLVGGNAVELFHDGAPAYESMLAAIRAAKHHIHMEFFITRGDESGQRFITALAERARAGVEVRFLYDAVGSWKLSTHVLNVLLQAGGKARPFMTPMNPIRRRVQINLRNHRKILVVDGTIGFTGGLNIGDEYLGRNPFFGAWRDTFMRLEGPAVWGLQRVFTEDWDFSTDEELSTDAYFPELPAIGDANVQVAWSGPDQDIKTIREVYLAAIVRARSRVWLATPYFVPDAALFDALCLAARMGRDVRVLCPFRPDKWLPHLAGRYIWFELLRAGGKIYQYTNGFMHAKVLLIDDVWSSVGSTNFDNRSLHLNFEVTCLIDSATVQKNLESAFLHDFAASIRLDANAYFHRPFVAKMAENACRLLSPVL